MPELTPERLAQLRAVAEAATQGPYEVVGLAGYGGPYALRMPHRSGRTWYGVEGIKRREDAEYFVAMNRNTVLALLDEIERLRQERQTGVILTADDIKRLEKQLAAARAEAERYRQQYEKLYQRTRELEHRLAYYEPDMYIKRCTQCDGRGRIEYPDTSTWRRGGCAGQAITIDVCDRCWGTGDEAKPGTDLRQLRKGIEALETFARAEKALRDHAATCNYYDWKPGACPDGVCKRLMRARDEAYRRALAVMDIADGGATHA